MRPRPGPILLALALVLTTTLLAARLLAPRLEDYRPQLEQVLSRKLGLPVAIQGLTLDWQGWHPVLALEGLSLHPAAGGTPRVSLSRAWLILDPWASLHNRRWTLERVRLRGLRLVLERRPDGRIVLLEGGERRPPDPQALVRALLAVDTLDLTHGELLLRPGGERPPLVLRSLVLSLRREGPDHRLGLSARPPPALGGELQGTARLRPRPEGGLAGDFYLRAPGLKSSGAMGLARQLGHSPPLAVRGELDLELWGQLVGWSPERLVGRTRLSGLGLERPPHRPTPDLPDLTGTFRLDRGTGGWLLAGDFETAKGHLALDLAWGRDGPRLALAARDLPLGLAHALVPPALDRALAGLGGRLTDLQLLFRGPDHYRLTGRFQDLALGARGRRPGLTGLTGTLALDPREGRLTLAEAPFTLKGGPLAVPVTLLPRGGLTWRHSDRGTTLTPAGLSLVNGDLALTLGGRVRLPEGQGPRLDLTAQGRMADLARLGRYLPVGIMKPRLVEWLKAALAAGRVPRGQLTLQGRPGDPQHPLGVGVQLEVADATLAFRPDWPPIRDLQARLDIHNTALAIQATGGRLTEGVEMAGVEAVIPDLRRAVLTVQGRARGSGTRMLAYLADSPLWQGLGDALGRLRVSGDNALDLTLTVPLDPSPPSVAGTVAFAGNRVAVAGSPVVLEGVRGDLQFTEREVRARNIRLSYRGEPARLAIDTVPGATRFRLEGELGPRALGEWAEPWLEGRSPTRVTLSVPNRGGPLDLTVTSSLTGTGINLPPPLGKPAAESRSLEARARIAAAGLELELDYGQEGRAALAFQGGQLERGEVRIGAGPARLPQRPGLDLIARLGEVSWPLGLPGGGEGGGLPPWLNGFDLRAARLVVGDYRLDGVVARGRNRAGWLDLELAGQSLAGRVTLPARPAPGRPLTVDLERLHLDIDPGASTPRRGAPPDPRRLPPLTLSVADLRLENRSLGRLGLRLQPVEGGARVEDLHLESPLHDLVMRGQWQAGEQGQTTRLNLEFRSHDLGQSLTRLGLEPGLEAGEADLSARLEWPGPLTAPDPARLGGEGTLSVGAGRLSRLEPGVGRVMGLLSLDNLFRRLTLDFRDLFREGLSFDRIDGSFTLKEGDLKTDNLILEGPTADLIVQGRIGLGTRDQTLEVIVLPQVSGLLPVAGAIAGGPAVGAALFLAERLLREDIGDVAHYRYRVTGTWEKPQLESLEQPRTPGRTPAAEFGDH